MSVKIYDSTIGAFKDAETPLIWNESAQAWEDSVGLAWNESAQAWEEKWSAQKILYLYDQGNQCADITGGWSNGWSYGGGGTTSLLANEFRVNADYGQNAKGLETNKAIDVSEYTKLIAEVTPLYCSYGTQLPNGLWMYAIDNRSTWLEINKCTYASHITSQMYPQCQRKYEGIPINSTTIIEYVLPRDEKSKYVGIASYGGGTWRVTKVWLEKN